MKKLICVALVCAALIPSSSWGAATGAIVGGFGRTASGSCLEVVGYSAGVDAGPSTGRWLGAYWTSAPTELPAGACSEEDDHIDLTVNCSQVLTGPDGSVALFAARGTDNKYYVVKMVDGGTEGDAFGIILGRPVAGAPSCGAADVATTPIVGDGFTIVAG
jgi:hypothetical protein